MRIADILNIGVIYALLIYLFYLLGQTLVVEPILLSSHNLHYKNKKLFPKAYHRLAFLLPQGNFPPRKQ
jgi:hypothetical protein